MLKPTEGAWLTSNLGLLLLLRIINHTHGAECNGTDVNNRRFISGTGANLSDLEICGRRCESSWICDPEKVLSSTQADEINKLINTVTTLVPEETKACRNTTYQIVAMVTANTSDEQHIHHVMTNLRTKWSKLDCDNFILVYLATAHKKVFTNTGKYAAEYLTPECIAEVTDQTEAFMDKGDFSKALKTTIHNFKFILSRGNCNYFQQKRNLTRLSFSVGGCFGALILICTVLSAVLMSKGLLCYKDLPTIKNSKLVNGKTRQELYRNTSYEGCDARS